MNAQTETGGQPSERAGEPSEEQLRAAYEAELNRISSVDMVLQAAASLLNIGAHRLGLTGAGADGPRDLGQVCDAIDAVRGLLPVIERSAPAELRPLRDALSQLQMAYSREVQAASAAQAPASESAAGGEQPVAPATQQGAPASAPVAAPAEPSQPGAPGTKPAAGPAESSGRLWVPGR
ncbi:MAG TPA: hypothetical protein VGL57_15720 [Solirubrobacteraceae bacterium]|jgi:hypothetical protein